MLNSNQQSMQVEAYFEQFRGDEPSPNALFHMLMPHLMRTVFARPGKKIGTLFGMSVVTDPNVNTPLGWRLGRSEKDRE